MLIILFTLSCLALVATLIAYTRHRSKLRHATQQARAAQAAARILSDHIIEMVDARDSAIYARDFYRAALNDIIRSTDRSDPAGQIARRFINYDDYETREA